MSTSEDNGTDKTGAGASRLSSETSGAADKAKGASKAGASKIQDTVEAGAATAAAGGKKAADKVKASATKGKDAADAKVSRRGNKKRQDKPMKIEGANPSWWVPVMLGLMVVGLIWIVVFYLTQGKAPLSIGKEGDTARYWNLAIGFGLIMVGFVMTTRWK